MSLIDLEKSVGVILEKRNMLHPPPTRVGLAIDGSGSMKGLYRAGVVQRTIDRVLAVATKFDDDGNLDAWMFDHDSHPLPAATPADYDGGYVERNILRRFNIDGGTAFHPVMSDVLRFYFPAAKQATAAPIGFFAGVAKLFGSAREVPKPDAAPSFAGIVPAFVIVVGDGQNSDRGPAAELLREAAQTGYPIYWQFVGIGDEKFTFMRTMADELPNVGFCEVRDLSRISNDDLYDRLLSQEFIDWIRQ